MFLALVARFLRVRPLLLPLIPDRHLSWAGNAPKPPRRRSAWHVDPSPASNSALRISNENAGMNELEYGAINQQGHDERH